jgi:hypothetical protein
MSIIYIDTPDDSLETKRVIQSAIESEINRLTLALELARQRLNPFERKYGVTSEHFITEMAAEDLEGADDEYIDWAGEYRLMQRLQDRLERLQGVEYGDFDLLRTN